MPTRVPADLEVHISIWSSALQYPKERVLIAFLDETHGDAGNLER
jgi:hypothetical protein